MTTDETMGTTFETRIYHFPRLFDKRQGVNDDRVDIYALDVPSKDTKL